MHYSLFWFRDLYSVVNFPAVARKRNRQVRAVVLPTVGLVWQTIHFTLPIFLFLHIVKRQRSLPPDGTF